MKIGVIGCGHMGSIVACALSGGNCDVYICDHNKKYLDKLVLERGCYVKTALEILNGCDVIVLGMKPQDMPDFLRDNREILQNRNNKRCELLIVSMAAGVTCRAIQDAIGFDCSIMRIMPNTPFSVGEGAVAYCTKNVEKNSFVEKCLDETVSLISLQALALQIDEKDMDAVVALSGSGPAFVYRFIDALKKAGVALGIDAKIAERLAIQTVLGSAKLAKKSTKDPSKLADEVCSPCGTTIEGVKIIDESDFNEVVQKTLQASFNRSVQLSQL